MAQTTLRLHAAGSLRAAMIDVAAAFQRQEGVTVIPAFGPSGALKERISQGEAAEVFASANLSHPQALADAGLAGPVVRFAGNRLCALTQPGIAATPETLLETLLAPDVQVGTSTPGSDPSGDYAWEVFRQAERLRPGSFAVLERKAMKLTGHPDAPPPPAGQSPYGWLMRQHRADVFLTYRTNAAVAVKEVPGLRMVDLPEALAVGAAYGLTVMRAATSAAYRFAMFILSPAGQEALAAHGFDAPGRPAGGH